MVRLELDHASRTLIDALTATDALFVIDDRLFVHDGYRGDRTVFRTGFTTLTLRPVRDERGVIALVRQRNRACVIGPEYSAAIPTAVADGDFRSSGIVLVVDHGVNRSLISYFLYYIQCLFFGNPTAIPEFDIELSDIPKRHTGFDGHLKSMCSSDR